MVLLLREPREHESIVALLNLPLLAKLLHQRLVTFLLLLALTGRLEGEEGGGGWGGGCGGKIEEGAGQRRESSPQEG